MPADLGAVYVLDNPQADGNADLPARIKVVGLAHPGTPDAAPPIAEHWALAPEPFGAVFAAPPSSLTALGYRRVKGSGEPAPAFETPAAEVGQ